MQCRSSLFVDIKGKGFLLGLLLSWASSSSSTAQAPSTQWQQSYGGSGNDQADVILQTYDSGYIVAGTTSSGNIDVSGYKGIADVWILKLNSSGNIQWSKCFGGSGAEKVTGMYAAHDSGYIITATSQSIDGDVINGNADKGINWTFKIDPNGVIAWQKNSLIISSMRTLPHGGYIVAGISKPVDYWIAKTDDTLGIIWQKSYGGSKDDRTRDIQCTLDGGYIVAGNTKSSDGDVKDYMGSFYDVAWVLKLDDTGGIQWNRTYKDGFAFCIRQLPDSTYLLAGQTTYPSVAARVHSTMPDYWLMKLDKNGDTLWQRAYGTVGGEALYAIQPTKDAGCVLAGFTEGGVAGDVGFSNGKADMWVVKVNHVGDIDWQTSLGGMYYEQAHDLRSTMDGGFVLAGFSSSLDGDVTRYLGGTDIWIVKLNSPVRVQSLSLSDNFKVYPIPANTILNIHSRDEVINKSASILDLSGRILKTVKLERFHTIVAIDDLAPGSYVIRVEGEPHNRFVTKF